MSLEKELSKQFVKKYSNMFTQDEWFWEQEIESLLNNYKSFIEIKTEPNTMSEEKMGSLIYKKAMEIYNSSEFELDAEAKYDLIFSEHISKKVYHLFDWCDPDTSYEEDVAAFMTAFTEYIENRN